MKSPRRTLMSRRKTSRRSFLKTALAGGALAGTASIAVTRDLFAQPSGPIVIGHHCDLTGVISSWGFWHDKAAKAAVDIINQGGGIAGRKVELVTEDTESNPAPGGAQAAQSDPAQQRGIHRRVGAFRRDARSTADRERAQDAVFLQGEATEVTGSKGTRFSFRTGTDTYSIAAASMPWCVENFGKAWTIIYADYAWGQSTNAESKLFIEKAGGKVLASIPVPLDTKDFVPYLAQVPADSQVVLPAFIGSLSVAFYTQAKSMGLDSKVKMFSSSASLESIDPGDIQGAAEGGVFLREFPAHAGAQERRLSQGVQCPDGHRRRLLSRDRRQPGDGQEPRLAVLGGHFCGEAGGGSFRLQAAQGY
jgi:branched-chain amino acid transport system substrate-binding protein